MKKYELIESNKVSPKGMPLFQVVALRDFGTVMKGDKGGYIESEANLSHEKNCWVYDSAQVFGNARVHGSARVYGSAWVYNSARVFGTAQVYGSARIYSTAWVYDSAQVFDDARVHGNARVYGDAQVYGNAQVYGDVWVYGGRAFATKNDHWDITEVDNGDGTATLYADATFKPVELKLCHGGQTGKFCSECGEKL